jgi:hypothetical protein
MAAARGKAPPRAGVKRKASNGHDGPWLSEAAAAVYLGVSARFLARHRLAGTGPEWTAFGRGYRYSTAALDTWAVRQPRP